MSKTLHGTCSCGTLGFAFSTQRSLGSLHPRACDCAFCLARGVHYLSDPAGEIVLSGSQTPEFLQQGSEQARFGCCPSCADLVFVMVAGPSGPIGAVNAQLLDQRDELGEPVVVSPRRLRAEDKQKRWASIWAPLSFAGTLDPGMARVD